MVLPQLRLEIVEWIQTHGKGYVPESLAMVELVSVLVHGKRASGVPLLRWDPASPQWAERDLIFWGATAAFPALALCLKTANDSTGRRWPGVESPWDAGSAALGMACGAARVLAREHSSRRVFVFLDDEALLQGDVWEMALEIGHERLANLTLLVSYSGLAKVEPLAAKWEAFGWKVFPLRDGHHVPSIEDALERAYEERRRPQVVLASTTLGQGIPFLQGKESYRLTRFSSVEFDSAQRALRSLTRHEPIGECRRAPYIARG